MRRLYRSALVAALVVLACSKPEDVIVIAMTHTYHRPTCFRVAMARTTKMPRAEAEALGMQPCEVCKPEDPP